HRCRWRRAAGSSPGGSGSRPAARGASRTMCGRTLPPRTPVKSTLKALVGQGIAALREQGTLPADLATPDFVIERPKDRTHGDFSSNAAMLLAKPARSNPRAIAQALAEAIPAGGDVAAVEIAGPGFLNFRLSPE